MAILKVCRMGHPVLRQRAAEVGPDQLGKAALRRLVEDMIETMMDEDGIGLAAPQVHRPLQLVVLGEPEADPEEPGVVPLQVLINPRIVHCSEETEEGWEGCLSLPGLRGVVPRAHAVRVEALDRGGKDLVLEAEGYHARVLQHEIDHLGGILFIDRMTDLRRLTFLEEYQRYAQHPAAADGEDGVEDAVDEG